MKSSILVLLENKHTLKNLDFLILLVTKKSMPKVIIINIAMMYHCVLHVQSMSLTSVASTVLIHSIAMFATKAFNLDCPYMRYIISSVIIKVISAVVNRSMSAKKLFRNDLNFEVSSGFSNSSFMFRICFLFWYWTAKSCKFFAALSRLGLISKVSIDKGKICSWVVEFHETGMPNFSNMSSK